MRLRTAYAGLLLLAAFTGCRKEPLPSGSEATPVFYFKGNASGKDLHFEAGNNGYRMLPSFHRDSNNLFVLDADLLSDGCADCYSLKVMINDHVETPVSSALYIDSALRLGHYMYNDRSVQPTEYVLELRPQKPLDPTGKYRWSISDAEYGVKTFTSYQVSGMFHALNSYTVNMEYEDATGCVTSHQNVYRFGGAVQPQILGLSLSNTDLTYSFSTVYTGSQPVSYYWQFGDGFASTEESPVHHYQVIGGNYYTATLTVTDAASNAVTTTYQVPGTPDPLCTANFSAAVTPVPNLKALSKVTVELTDPSGKTYSTKGFFQPAGNDFEVVELSGYKANDQGFPTKKFKALFSCLLKNGSEEILLTNGEAVLAVAYK